MRRTRTPTSTHTQLNVLTTIFFLYCSSLKHYELITSVDNQLLKQQRACHVI